MLIDMNDKHHLFAIRGYSVAHINGHTYIQAITYEVPTLSPFEDHEDVYCFIIDVKKLGDCIEKPLSLHLISLNRLYMTPKYNLSPSLPKTVSLTKSCSLETLFAARIQKLRIIDSIEHIMFSK